MAGSYDLPLPEDKFPRPITATVKSIDMPRKEVFVPRPVEPM